MSRPHSSQEARLQSPRELITSLLSSVPTLSADHHNTQNVLASIAPREQDVFLTLHVLFPNEFLPALDVLDRGLVTRLVTVKPPSELGSVSSPGKRLQQLLVRSAQPHRYRSNAAYEHTAYHEVRLDAWSCACPAFTFAAFPSVSTSSVAQVDGGPIKPLSPDQGWHFGGLTRGTDIPICKHLLACTLVCHCSLFSQFVEDREVSMEEFAGWAAGWGD